MTIQKDLKELQNAKVISAETAADIEQFYANKKAKSSNNLLIAFAALGSILIGFGIISILAHNWDELAKSSKTLFAFLPLVLGQIACALALFKFKESIAWREGASVFLFFAVGASIAIIAQIYHLPSNGGTFMLTWMLLLLPQIYIMNSSITSLLYLLGAASYTTSTAYQYGQAETYSHWLLLFAIIPFYINLIKKKADSGLTISHHWFITISFTLYLGTVADSAKELLFPAYFSLFAIFYFLGERKEFSNLSFRQNAYRRFGVLGSLWLLFMTSFDSLWDFFKDSHAWYSNLFELPELYAALILFGLAASLFWREQKKVPLDKAKPFGFVFIVFHLIFILGFFTSISVLLINLVILAIGVQQVWQGNKSTDRMDMSFGLLIISTLILCRFFDMDLDFTTKGFLFVAVGFAFLLTNTYLAKKALKNAE